MIDLPPPPVQACIRATSTEVARARIILTVSGDAEQVGAFLPEQERHPVWTRQADARSNDIRFLRLTAPADIPYREIGSLIFEAQRRQLEVSVSTVPPICESEER